MIHVLAFMVAHLMALPSLVSMLVWIIAPGLVRLAVRRLYILRQDALTFLIYSLSKFIRDLCRILAFFQRKKDHR